jgi:hypothetical protein
MDRFTTPLIGIACVSGGRATVDAANSRGQGSQLQGRREAKGEQGKFQLLSETILMCFALSR